MANEDFLTRLLVAADSAAAEDKSKLNYIYDQVESGKREDSEIKSLKDTAAPILKRLGV